MARPDLGQQRPFAHAAPRGAQAARRETVAPPRSAPDRPSAPPATMGRGGEKSVPAEVEPLMRRNSWSFGGLKGLADLKDDLTTLRHLWFSQLGSKSKDHATRLEQFYGPQAAACEQRRGRSLGGQGIPRSRGGMFAPPRSQTSRAPPPARR